MGRRSRTTEQPPEENTELGDEPQPLYPDDGPEGDDGDPDDLLSMGGTPAGDPRGLDDDLGNDPGADMAAHFNSNNRTDLSGYEAPPIGAGYNPPPPFGGDPGMAGIGLGPTPQPITGRPTTPPIWAHAHLFPAAPQLRCWKLHNGVPHLLGPIDSKATEEDFIQHFIDSMPKPGDGSATFVIRPINAQGLEVREEITLPPISEHNVTLKQVRAARAAAAPVVANPMPAPDYSGVNRMQEKMLDLYSRQVDAAIEQAKWEREHAQNMQADVARQTVELTQRSAMGTEAVAERMMKADADRTTAMLAIERQRADEAAKREAERNAAMNTTMQGMFTQMQTLMMQAQERERNAFEQRMREDDERRRREQAEYERRLDRERQEADTKRERERLELEDRRERERREWEQKFQAQQAEQQARWQREQAEAERREREREAERQRQHEMRLKEMETTAQRDREHAERMAALNGSRDRADSMEGTLEKIGKVATMFGFQLKDLPDIIRGGDEEEKPTNPSEWTPLAQILAPALTEAVRTFGGVVQTGMAMRMGQPGMIPYQGGPAQMAPGQVPAGYIPQQVPPQTAPQQGAPAATPEAAAPAAPAAPAGPQSSLPLATQKAARNAIRDLVKALRNSGQDKWQEVIGFAIAGEQAIYHYCKEVTIKTALIEGGADEQLVMAVFNHPAATMIPNDVPRG